MMESLFQNHYTRTKKDFGEFYHFVLFRQPVFIIIDCLLLLSLIGNCIDGIRSGIWELAPITIAILFPFLKLFLHTVYAKIAYKRDLEYNRGAEMPISISFFDTYLLHENATGSRLEIPYTQIKRIHKTKNFILIKSNAKTVYMVRKDSFTQGDLQGFTAF